MRRTRISHRFRAAYRLAGGVGFALLVGLFGGALLWDGMNAKRLPTLLFGLVVLGTEYVGLRIALGSMLHPAALFVRRLDARQALAGEMLETKDALENAVRLVGWPTAPKLYVMDSAQVNAFTTGRNHERVLGVTKGFAEYLSREEQYGVLATLFARECDDAGVAEAVSSVLGPTITPVPEEGVRPDFARSIAHYHDGDILGVRLLGEDAGALARALRVAYDRPGSIKPATPAVADQFFVWPCGQAVTPQEEALERKRLLALLQLLDATGAKE